MSAVRQVIQETNGVLIEVRGLLRELVGDEPPDDRPEIEATEDDVLNRLMGSAETARRSALRVKALAERIRLVLEEEG